MKIFSTYIKEYMFQPNERLFDTEAIMFLKDFQVISDSTIYAIVRTPKIEYKLETFISVGNYCFKGEIKVGNESHTIMINVPKTWYEVEKSDLSIKLRTKHKSISHFIDYEMSKYHNPEFPSMSNQEKYMYLAKVDLDKSDAKNLSILCPIATALNGGEAASTTLPLYQTINMFDIDCIESLDVCYIGKSTSSTFERLKKHEKWGPILSDSKAREGFDYLAYFFVIDEAEIIRKNFGMLESFSRKRNKVEAGAIVQLCEASLINYFKPEFNKDIKNADLSKNKLVKFYLKEKGYSKIVTEVELDGVLGRLSTAERKQRSRHEFTLDLSI